MLDLMLIPGSCSMTRVLLAWVSANVAPLFSSLSNPMLVAWQAYEEMFHDYAQLRDACRAGDYFLNTPMPTLIAALAVGDEVFFASQLHGQGAKSFVYITMADVGIMEQLNLCQAYLTTDAENLLPNAHLHHRRAVCAEIFVTAMYMKKHNNQSPRAVTGGGKEGQESGKARVVVWGNHLTNDKESTFLAPPCGPASNPGWGCTRFMEYQGIRIVNIQKYSIDAWQERHSNPSKFPPINQIEPVETEPQGVPIFQLYTADDFSDRLDSD
ncbi:MAG: hypothetical protein Q9179_007385 [Wetmoreana sp. 5 TL-2023]